MRRLVLLALLVGLVAEAEAQIRLGLGLYRRKSSASVPLVQITGPTADPTFQTDATSIDLRGFATAPHGLGIASVSVRVNGGAVIPTIGDEGGLWSIEAVAGMATKVQDTFQPTGANIDVTTRVSTPSGGAITEVTDTGTAGYFELQNGTGAVRPNASDTNDRMIAIFTPTSALSGTDYTLSIDVSSVAATSGAAQGVVFGAESGATPDDYCGTVIMEATANPDLFVVKVVGGVVTDVAGVDANIGPGDTVLTEVDGSAILVRKEGTIVISTSTPDCDTGSQVGLFCGNVRTAGDDCNVNFSMDNFEVMDRGGSSAGVPLTLGTNTIIVTATDTASAMATDELVVTRTGSDTTDPTVAIQSPTTGPVYGSPTATVTLGGISSDNVAVASVTMSCPLASPTNPTVTGTTSWTAAAITLTSAVTATCTATVTDTAARTATAVIQLTYNAGDITAPVTTITTNGGSGAGVSFSTSATTVSLGGTCTDNIACSVVTFTCAQCSGGGAVSGAASWAIASIPLTPNVMHIIDVRGCDVAGNCHTDSITVTRTVMDLTIATTTLPNGINGTPYPNTCINAIGGVAPYAWSISVGALPGWATLNPSTGCISGTPNAEVTTNFTVLVTDSQGSPDTDPQPLSITVVAPGAATAHSDFNTRLMRADCWIALSLRPVASGSSTRPTGCENPHFRYQLQEGNGQSYLNVTNPGPNDFTWGWEFDYANDTDANKQDAAAVTIPAFVNVGSTLAAGIDSSATTIVVTAPSSVACLNNSGMRIGNEIVKQLTWTSGCPSPTTFTVERGAYGTTAAAHTMGDVVQMSYNSFAGHQLRVPFPSPKTEDGYTYVITWDTLHTNSYFDIGAIFTAQKSYQVAHRSGGGGFWFEPRKRWHAGTMNYVSDAHCSDTLHAYSYTAHAYMLDNGPADWTVSNGSSLGPGWASPDATYIQFPALAPGAVAPAAHCAPVNKWVHSVIRIKQIASNYDLVDFWACNEGEVGCTQLYTALPMSVPQTYSTPTPGTNQLIDFFFRYNTSEDRYRNPGPGKQFSALRNYERNWSVHRATTASGTLETINSSNFLVNPVR